ncbi:MAG: LysM peptidoglycan-binding domain-containing protein [Streptococcaceae bacterium]|jgi:LysM repeat protein|nr:LysM peptidoglycan-binding domain-containing protein [Streptococcaceae bacterium]
MAFNNKKDKAKEPWKLQIYDTEQEASNSRLAQRKKKRGNTLFIRLLVILLIVIVSIPTLFYFLTVGKSRSDNVNVAKPSSTKKAKSNTRISSNTSSKNSSQVKNLQTTTSSEEEDLSSMSNASTNNSTTSSSKTPTQQYETVEEGEGLQQIAQRVGISVEILAKLNGITLNLDGSFYPAIYPGQELRIN